MTTTTTELRTTHVLRALLATTIHDYFGGLPPSSLTVGRNQRGGDKAEDLPFLLHLRGSNRSVHVLVVIGPRGRGLGVVRGLLLIGRNLLSGGWRGLEFQNG